MTKIVRVWVCPTDGCGNYFASSSMGVMDLTTVANVESDLSHTRDSDPAHPRVTGNRGVCPDCRMRGLGLVQRVPITVTLELDPTKVPIAPAHALPAS